MIYTTNAIESFNSALRKVTDRKAAFPSEMAVMKILYLRTLDVVENGQCLIRTGALFVENTTSFGASVGICDFVFDMFTQSG